MTVLILTEKADVTADRVVLALRERGVPLVRCDTADVPARVGISAVLTDGRWGGTLRAGPREVSLEEVRSVWYRATPRFGWPSGMSEPRRRHADTETRLGLGGVLAELPARWINHPSAQADAEYKPRQLHVAHACGLRVPTTMVSMVAADVRAFLAAGEVAVIKPLGANVIVDAETTAVAHTHVLVEDDVVDLSGIELGPHLIQHWVDKDHEVRLTAVGDRMFAAAIRSGSPAGRVDWRRDYAALSYNVTTIPDEVRDGVLRYLGRLGLVFAAFDFVVRPDGEWVFLEANPGGQFGWIQQETGLPIAEALADELASGRKTAP